MKNPQSTNNDKKNENKYIPSKIFGLSQDYTNPTQYSIHCRYFASPSKAQRESTLPVLLYHCLRPSPYSPGPPLPLPSHPLPPSLLFSGPPLPLPSYPLPPSLLLSGHPLPFLVTIVSPPSLPCSLSSPYPFLLKLSPLPLSF